LLYRIFCSVRLFSKPTAATLLPLSEQVDALKGATNTTGNPLLGAKTWAKNNRKVVQPWIDLQSKHGRSLGGRANRWVANVTTGH
jgi:hypothetical protein